MLQCIETLAAKATRAELAVMTSESRLSRMQRKMARIREEAIATDMSDEAFRAWVMDFTAQAMGPN